MAANNETKVQKSNTLEQWRVATNTVSHHVGDIDLYFKVLAAGDDSDFDSLTWTAAPPDTAIVTNDSGAYNEVHYTIDPAIGKFGSFAFKIIFRSTNTSNVPTIKDFRAVAAT